MNIKTFKLSFATLLGTIFLTTLAIHALADEQSVQTSGEGETKLESPNNAKWSHPTDSVNSMSPKNGKTLNINPASKKGIQAEAARRAGGSTTKWSHPTDSVNPMSSKNPTTLHMAPGQRDAIRAGAAAKSK